MATDITTERPLLADGMRVSADTFTEADNKGFELVYGVVREKKVSSFSDHFQFWLLFFFSQAVESYGGIGSAPEGGFQCFDDPGLIRKPDLSWTRASDFSSPGTQGWRRTPPTFAIEVLSPRNTAAEITEKVAMFLKAGTEMVWVIDPVALTAVVHTSNDAVSYDSQTLLPAPLPTLTISLADVEAKARRDWPLDDKDRG